MPLTSTQQTQINRLFVGMFGCAPGVTYMNACADYIATGGTVASLASLLTTSSVFTSASFYPSSFTSTQFANKLVTNLLSGASTAAQAAAKTWIESNDGVLNRGEIIRQAVEALSTVATSDTDWGSAAGQLTNRVTVADFYYTSGGSSTDVGTLQGVVSPVTSAASTVTAQQAAITAGTSGGATGQTFTLTTNIDGGTSFTGTPGNDVFGGAIVGENGTGTSLNPGDAMIGNAGTDTLNINVSGSRGTGDVTTAAFTLTSIENVLVSNYATANQKSIIDLANADSNLAKIGLSSSSTSGTGVGSTKFDNVQKIVDVELKNGGADFAVGYAASALTGTADVQNVTLSNHTATTAPTLTLTEGIETLALTSSGSSNKIQLAAGNKHTKVTVAGDKNLTLDVNDTTNDTIATVDASTFTGNLTLSGLADATGTKLSVTGGAGNDTVTVPANLSSNDSIDGGTGTNTLKVDAALTAANAVNVKNFQVLQATSNISQDASAVAGVTKVVSSNSTNGTVTFSNLGATTALGITGGNDTNDHVTATLKTDTTADSIDITIGAATATSTTGITMGTLTLNNHETLSLASTGGTSAAANSINALTSSNATKLTVTGDRDLTITAFTSSSSLKTLDASAFTGKLTMGAALTASGNHTLTGGSAADSLVGGSGNDVIVGGAGNDTINGTSGDDNIDGGAGDDSITVGAASAATKVVTVTGGEGADTVTMSSATGYFNVDLGAGDDTIKVASGNTLYFDANDTIVGGDGTDALSFVATAGTAQSLTSTTTLSNVSGFERVVLDVSGLTSDNDAYSFTFDDVLASGVGSGTLNIAVKDATTPAAHAGADVTINASGVLLNSTKVNVDTSAAAVQYVYHIGGATENVVLGAQADTVLLATAGHLSANDTIDGGAGADKLALNYATNSSTDVTINTSTWSNVKSFETINLDNRDGTGTGAIVFTLTDAFATNNRDLSTNTLTAYRYDASGTAVTDADDTGTTKLDGSAVAGTKLVLGGAGGADTIIGGALDDTLTGNGGNDSLTGGAGNDTFQFVTAASNGTDRITDFSFGTSTTSVDKLGMVGVATFTWNSAFDTVQRTTTSTTIAADSDVIVIDDRTFTDAAAMNTAVTTGGALAITGTDSKIIVWQNSIGTVYVTYDHNGETTGGQTHLAILEGVTITGIASLIDTGDFIVA